MPGREEGRRDSEDEQEQGKISQQLVLPASAGFNECTPASLMELDLPGARVRMVNEEEPGIQAQKMSEKDRYQTPQVNLRWKRMHSWRMEMG